MARHTLVGWLLLSLWMVAGVASADERRFGTLEDGAGGVPYAVHLPGDFDAEVAYPVLISPGDGTPGSDYSFFWRSGCDPASYGWILVESPVMFGASAKKDTTALLDHLADTYRVEGFHLMGFSANSGPVYEVALELGDRLTSVTGIPGHPRTRDPEALKALRGVKIHFIVGENDTYWLQESQRSDEQLRGLGVTTVLDVVENGEHVLDELIGDGLMARMERMRPQKP